MRIKPYVQYFKYVCEHKRNVFRECIKSGLYLRGITHDLSKFRPSEFIPYARYFYVDKERYENDFEKAWELHYKRNKHHPEHWIRCKTLDGFEVLTECDPMSEMDIEEMICDWKAMSRKFGGSAQEYYLKNYYKFPLHTDSRRLLDYRLGFTGHYGVEWFKDDSMEILSLGEIAFKCKNRREFENLIEHINKMYPGIDLYDSVHIKVGGSLC